MRLIVGVTRFHFARNNSSPQKMQWIGRPEKTMCMSTYVFMPG